MPDAVAAARRSPSLAGIVAGVMALAGAMIGMRGLSDNSFLTHLATGQLMLDTHRVPAHDPYTFTVPGRAWVVQSWLASLLYGLADRAAASTGLLLLVGSCTAVLGLLVWTLTRPAGSLIGRLLVAIVALTAGGPFWIERPLTFGLVALGVTLLAAEGRLDPRWLVPVTWLWVNLHGSFPLGLVALATLALGRRLDGERPAVELRALKFAALGTVLGAVNPLGPKLLVFPIELLQKQDVLRNIVEWQAPRFTGLAERAFLVEIVLVVIALTRNPRWRTAVPTVVFVLAALLGARNVVVASLVMVPGIATGFRGLGSLDGSDRRTIFRPVAMVLVAAGLLVAVIAPQRRGFEFDSYPVAAVSFADRAGLVGPGHRLVTQDIVGNYLEARYGPRAAAFIDDRYDMVPPSLVDDYKTLLGGGRTWSDVLDRWQAEAVLWDRDQPLTQLLRLSPAWRIVYEDAHWVVARRR